MLRAWGYSMIKDYRRKPDWFERHAGLGGWLGSVGTVLAILAAWWLAHQEYLRAVGLDNERTNSEIALISRTASEFDRLVQTYIADVKVGNYHNNYFYRSHLNDAEFRRLDDINSMPITQWPSVASYDAFKRYDFAAITVLKTSEDLDWSSIGFERRVEAYEGTLEEVQKALNAARK